MKALTNINARSIADAVAAANAAAARGLHASGIPIRLNLVEPAPQQMTSGHSTLL